MIIVCNKLEQDANLKSQKEKIKSSAVIQKLRQSLIDIQNENLAKDSVEKARIEGQVRILQAKSQKEAEELKGLGKASVELERMKAIIGLLSSDSGEKYLELIRAQQFANVKQNWVVSSDSKVNLALQQ